jgi:hypothetical protein
VNDSHPREEHRQKLASEWTVTTTPMTQEQAEEAASLLDKRWPDVYVMASDPRAFLTLGLDRWSAEAVRAGLSMVVEAGGDVGVLLEELDDFLAYGHPYRDSEEHWPGITPE